jgi:hypothetical protein
MNLDLHAFALGVISGLEKSAEIGSVLGSHMGENILPTFEGQRKWKYRETPEGLRLSDGNHVWSFGIHGFGGEVSKVPRIPDVGILDFERGGKGGTAQVHRSSPDSVYLTLHNGRENPTFYLEHQEGQNWRYIPGKRLRKMLASQPQASSIPVDPESLLEGAEKMAFDMGLGANDMNNLLWKGVGLGKGLLSGAAAHPLLTIGGVLGGGLLLHGLRKRTNPQYRMESMMDPSKEVQNGVALPLLVGGGLVGIGNSLK